MPTLVLNGAKLTVHPKEQTSLDRSTPSETCEVPETCEDPATGEETQRLSVSSGISVECFEEEELDIHESDHSLTSAGESKGHVHTLPRESGEKVKSRNGSVATTVIISETEEQDSWDRVEDVFTVRGSQEEETALVPRPNEEQKPVESASEAAQSSVRILRIEGFTPAMNKETVEMFLENQSGEIELDSCDFDVEAGVAIVAFKNPQGNKPQGTNIPNTYNVNYPLSHPM
ncbi:hypothetical protein NP493_2729g00005 [Ridgeia piscesae]|uniref:Uncharacterized protein n=1 Tax=Ridgeia piscesae TaxID=27915 RepID=A0AAD9N0S4_RIDPI|nr:hypothetical protein NP493_2729g00005 [Ridgeia piscesae]